MNINRGQTKGGTMYRFAVISDMHSSKGHFVEEARIITRYLGGWLLKPFHRTMKAAIANHRHVRATLEKMNAGDEPYDGIIGLGDYSEKGNREESKEVVDLLKEYFNDTKMSLAPGNHDTGSWMTISDRWCKHFDEKHLSQFERSYGPLFGSAPLGDETVLVWLLSEPFVYDWRRHRHIKEGKAALLSDLLAKQLKFLENVFSDAKSASKKVVIAIHDPYALMSPVFKKIIKEHRSRILATLIGHIHARWLMNLICLQQFKLWWRMWRIKAVLIPSIWGVALPGRMIGAGWAEL